MISPGVAGLCCEYPSLRKVRLRPALTFFAPAMASGTTAKFASHPQPNLVYFHCVIRESCLRCSTTQVAPAASALSAQHIICFAIAVFGQSLPDKRMKHSAVAYEDKLYLFGGHSMNDGDRTLIKCDNCTLTSSQAPAAATIVVSMRDASLFPMS